MELAQSSTGRTPPSGRRSNNDQPSDELRTDTNGRPNVVRASLSQAVRIDQVYEEELVELLAALVDPENPGKAWAREDYRAVEILDGDQERARFEAALRPSGGSYAFVIDTERFMAVGSLPTKPPFASSERPLEISWKVRRLPASSGGRRLISVAVGLAFPTTATPSASTQSTDDFAELAEDVENVLFAHFSDALFELMFEFDVLRDDFDRTVQGRQVGSPYFYVYQFEERLNLDDPSLRLLTRTHFGRAGPDSLSVEASLVDDGIIVLRRMFDPMDALQPFYVIVAGASTDDTLGVELLAENLANVEGVAAIELWDISTDAEMHQDHLAQHDLAVDEIRLVLNESLADSKGAAEPHLVQRVLSALDQRIVTLGERMRNTHRQFEFYDNAVADYVHNHIDERRTPDERTISFGLTQGRVVGELRRTLDRLGGDLARVQASYEYLHGSAGRIAEDARSRDVAFLDRQGWTMNVLLGLLAVVLAFEAVVDFRFNSADDRFVRILQTGTLVVAAVAAAGIAYSLFRRARPAQAHLPSPLADALEFISDADRASKVGFNEETDRTMARRFTQIWASIDDPSRSTERLSRALLRASRPAQLYGGSCPWLATSYMAALRIADWEFEKAISQWGFVPFLHATKLREAIRDGPRSPSLVIAALEKAEAGVKNPADVIRRFANELGLDPAAYELEEHPDPAELSGAVPA